MVPPGDLAFFRKDTGSAGVSRLYLYILAAKSLYTIAANDLYIIARELTTLYQRASEKEETSNNSTQGAD